MKMYLKVRAFLQSNASQIGLNALVAGATEFNDKINHLLDSDVKSVSDITGYTISKQHHRDAAKISCITLAKGLAAYYDAVKDQNSLRDVLKTRSELENQKELDFYDTCMLIISKVPASPTRVLADYGVSTALIQEAQTHVKEYIDYMSVPRDMQGLRISLGLEVDQLMDETDMLLHNQLDMLVGTIEFTNPALFSRWQTARAIDHMGGGSGTPPDYTIMAAPNAFTVVAQIPYQASRSIEIRNNGKDSIQFGLSSSDTSFSSPAIQVDGGQSRNRRSSNISPSGDYLLISNPSTQAQEIEIWLDE